MLPDWKQNLTTWIEQNKDRRFSWGVHDCFVFTNTAWRKMTGKGYADEWYDRYYDRNYRPLSPDQMREEFGYQELYEALDEKLKRVPVTSSSYGNLVGTTKRSNLNTTRVALGICLGDTSVFVGTRRLEFLPTDDIEFAWSYK